MQRQSDGLIVDDEDVEISSWIISADCRNPAIMKHKLPAQRALLLPSFQSPDVSCIRRSPDCAHRLKSVDQTVSDLVHEDILIIYR